MTRLSQNLPPWSQLGTGSIFNIVLDSSLVRALAGRPAPKDGCVSAANGTVPKRVVTQHSRGQERDVFTFFDMS